MESLYVFTILVTVLGAINCDNVGWNTTFIENNEEFHNLLLHWEMGDQTNVPTWLSGVYIRNGPAQMTFGSDKRKLSSWLDGFAKLHSFKFDGRNVYFSGKMVASSTYMDSMENGELVPQITLSTFQNPEDEWTYWEYLEMFQRDNMFDNINPAVWRLGSKENPIFIAATDFPWVQKFNIDTLETLELLKPKKGQNALTGIAHWHREVGTENSLYLMGHMGGIIQGQTIQLQRYTPDQVDISNPEIVADIRIKKNSYLHSFSITENYAIILYPPVVLDSGLCLMMNSFHIMECIKVLEDEQTDVYVVNLKTGEVKETTDNVLFSMHHINAYESEDGKEIMLDLSPTDEMGIRDYPKLSNMMNPPDISNGDNTSTCGNEEVTRYHINLEDMSIKSSRFPNLLKDTSKARYVNKFDMGIINEAYRGKEYCVIYGWSSFDYSRSALVKKNVCDATKDRVIYTENHYPSEMYFIANPEGIEEDDGVLISLAYDGPREQTYLLVLDAKEFEEIDRAYLPHNIPNPLSHGMHFPEAEWSL